MFLQPLSDRFAVFLQPLSDRSAVYLQSLRPLCCVPADGGMAELDWQRFRAGCARLLLRSRQLGDGWQWREAGPVGDDGFLVRTVVVPAPSSELTGSAADSGAGVATPVPDLPTELAEEQLEESDLAEEPSVDPDPSAAATGRAVWLLEHHVAFSRSYRVPLLLLAGRHQSGRPLQPEQVWQLAPAEHAAHLQQHGWSTLSLLEHPVLQRLFLAVHPCHTARLMALTLGDVRQTGQREAACEGRTGQTEAACERRTGQAGTACEGRTGQTEVTCERRTGQTGTACEGRTGQTEAACDDQTGQREAACEGRTGQTGTACERRTGQTGTVSGELDKGQWDGGAAAQRLSGGDGHLNVARVASGADSVESGLMEEDGGPSDRDGDLCVEGDSEADAQGIYATAKRGDRTGQDGSKGRTGQDGSKGRTGQDGSKSRTGQNGSKGRTGQDGSKGRTGQDGSKGRTGQDGSEGRTGQDGSKGRTGQDGSKGRTGQDGSKGRTGQDGAEGRIRPDRTGECSDTDKLREGSLSAEQKERAYRYLLLWLTMFGPICGLKVHEAYAAELDNSEVGL